jgi:hypothetical protein
MKTALADRLGDPTWANVRAPLIELDSFQQDDLLSELISMGFTSTREQLS